MVCRPVVGGLTEVVEDTRLGSGARITLDVGVGRAKVWSFLQVNRVVEDVVTHSELLIVIHLIIDISLSIQVTLRQLYFSREARAIKLISSGLVGWN